MSNRNSESNRRGLRAWFRENDLPPNLQKILKGRHYSKVEPVTPGMETHYMLDRLEEIQRDRIVRKWGSPVIHWLEYLDLFQSAFQPGFDWKSDFPKGSKMEAANLSQQLLCLSATESKVLLDLITSGYPHVSVGILRTLCEALLRIDAVLKDPSIASDYIEHTKRNPHDHFKRWPHAGTPFDSDDDADRRELRTKLFAIMKFCNYGSHASLVGIASHWRKESAPSAYFGPVMSDDYVESSGQLISAGLAVLRIMIGEIVRRSVPTVEWAMRAKALNDQVLGWESRNPFPTQSSKI